MKGSKSCDIPETRHHQCLLRKSQSWIQLGEKYFRRKKTQTVTDLNSECIFTQDLDKSWEVFLLTRLDVAG